MGTLVNFLIDNYIFIVFIAILLMLTLVGYIVDNTKNNKGEGLLSKKDENDFLANIPLANIDANVKLGDNLNKMAMMNNQNATPQEPTVQAAIENVAPVETVNVDAQKSPLDVGKQAQ